ncbi:MAG: hypothetical protein G01um101413_253 [Parcubacteria group bacterium Gr01-1014_13]|nr:MAG: hypothetical protein G01um101413_253 [Parcubacteria group bacterium Gr01-1014_13]
MDLNRSKWYVRWYFWSLGIMEEFWERWSMTSEKERAGTNLCQFMRTILFSAPLVLLLNAIVYISALASLTVLPIYLFGFKIYGVGLGAVVTLVLLIISGSYLYNSWTDRKLKQVDKPKKTDTANPSFVRVVWRFVQARKQKICPLVTFVKENNKEVQS